MTPPPHTAQPHLLVVDDDPDITDLIATYFCSNGFTVTAAHSGEAMRQVLDREKIDLVMLDLGLPDADGIALTRSLRERWQGAVIIVSGRGESVDRIIGLEVGADDYVSKPFELRELLARAKSVLRRVGAAPAQHERIVLAFAGFRLDMAARTLSNGALEKIDLTTGEFDLLAALARNPQRVLSRDQLMEMTRSRESGPFDRAIDVQVGRLRKKLNDDAERPTFIKAVRGAGYLFAVDVVTESR